MTCVVVRDGQATIAQAGPGLVYLLSDDGTRRVTTAGEPAATPLGSDGEITPQFVAAPTADTNILLLSSFAETGAGPSAIGRVFGSPPDRLLGDLFLQVRNVPDVHAVLISDAPGGAEAPDFGDRPAAGEADGGGPAPVELFPGPRAPAFEHHRRLQRRQRHAAPPTHADAAPRARGRRDGPAAVAMAARGARRRRRARRRRHARPAAARGGRGGAVRGAAPPRAGGLLDAAAETQDAAAQRESLNAALRNLEEARSIDDADPRIASLQDAIQSRLDEVNRVIEIDRLDPLLRFEGVVTQPLTPEALVLRGATGCG